MSTLYFAKSHGTGLVQQWILLSVDLLPRECVCCGFSSAAAEQLQTARSRVVQRGREMGDQKSKSSGLMSWRAVS